MCIGKRVCVMCVCLSEVRSENKCDETCEKNVKNYTTMKNRMRAHNHSAKQTKIIAKQKQKQN